MPATKRVRTGSVATPPKSKPRVTRASIPRPITAFRPGNQRRTGFPDTLQVRLKYCEGITITSSTGLLQTYLYSANGLFDPNITAGGQQPLYYDQLVAIYDHYTVMASRIRVTFAGAGSVSGPQVYCGIIKDDDTSTNYTSFQACLSDDMGSKSWGLTGGVANAPLVINQYFDAKKTYGLKALTDDNTMSGSASTNPTEQTYFRLCVQEAASSNTVTVNAMVEIEYDAVFRERKDIPIS